MSTITGEIQPVSSGQWIVPETQPKEVQSIAPVSKAEGDSAAKVSDFGANAGAGADSATPQLSTEVIQQIQSFVKQNMGLDLSFIAGAGGKTVVQVLDSKTGKVICQIPPDNLRLFRDKIEQLQGILFDGKA